MASTSTSGRGEQAPDPFLVLEPPNKKIKSSLSTDQYDVFINYGSPDVKKILAQQLCDSLHQKRIQAYLDVPKTELGDYFTSAIRNAIFSARLHIAILSPQYVESAWCLAELALMFKTKARIIPLFYNVNPSDFRHIRNEVADAFRKHEKKGSYPSHDIQQWKDCLQNVSGIKGYEFNGHNDDLNKLCNDLVSAAVNEKRKRKNPFSVVKCEVGLDELANDFHRICQVNGEVRGIIIITGMGGSGKTTLAKYLVNRKQSEFDGSTILFDVGENDVKGALTSLQFKLLDDLFSGNRHNFSSVEEGIASIKDFLLRSHKLRFLIVLDDVDHKKQLDALVHIDALNPNSLVIVTTRHVGLLKHAEAKVIYRMKSMNKEHSMQLFCWHAFHRQTCKSGFEELVQSFVHECGGLPLALRVMGGHVFGSDEAYLESQLNVAKEARKDIGTRDMLKISYDALEEDQKQIFMDIGCFFVGEDVSRAISIWKASGWRAEHALQTLKDKCLVEVQNCFQPEDLNVLYQPTFILRMHDNLRDLARHMANKEMSHPRRLWLPHDLIRMHDIKGVRGILTLSEGKSFRCYSRTVDNASNLVMAYLLENSRTSTGFQWLELHSVEADPQIPEWLFLKNLQSLRVKGISPARLWLKDDQVPLKLKELYWSFGYLNKTGFKKDMGMTDLNKLVSSFGILKCLESLQLNFGSEIFTWNWFLKSVRELTNLKTLELTSFQLEGKFALSNSGETTYNRFCMRSLEAITLCDGLKTRSVSISGQLCPTLKSLKLYSMSDLSEVDLTGVTTLECLMLLRCGKLRNVLGNDLVNLEIFRIKLCRRMRKLPYFGSVSCLKRIYISRCRNLQDISAIERLKGLKMVWIAYCPEVQNIKAINQLKGLKRIWIEGCTQLEGVVCFKELKELKRIFIGGCTRLQNIQGIEFLLCLESIIVTGCPKLQDIRGIEELKGLNQMIISDSPIISSVERLQRLAGELTILVGRPATSYFEAAKIDETLSIADAFCEIDCKLGLGDRLEEKIYLFLKTQSLSTFIFCTILDGFPCIGSDICNGTRIMLDKCPYIRPTSLSRGGGEWIYMCVFDEAMMSKYDSWKPSKDTCFSKAFLMGVKKGVESKTLHILQSLFAQLCVDNGKYSGAFRRYSEWEDIDYDDAVDEDADDHNCVDYDDLAEYADYDDEDEEYGGGDEHDDSSKISFQPVESTSSFRAREQELDRFWGSDSTDVNRKSSTADRFDVFINHHRRSDVQTSLAGQLYNILKQAGIRAFLDSEELGLGNSFPSTINNAISSAAVHITILSPGYAESASCLVELALIFKTKARIIPLFYHVQPSDFRYIKSEVADAFSKKKGTYPSHDIQQWKECLQKVSGIRGYELNGQNDDADLLCKTIVSVVKKEVENPKVGLDELVEDFERHCQQERGLKDNIIGILGTGGSGKTTLANELFNRKRSKYVRSCSLFGVREASVNGDLTSLQTKLLDDLFYQNLSKFFSTEEGIGYIKRCLIRNPILSFLIVIDDVDQKSQLDALLPIDTLNSNSLVIITTRDERVLIEAGIRVRYKVKGMDEQHSRKLFCWRAFHKPDPETGYEDLVKLFVKECGGLPLSLQALGEHVSGRSKDGWKSELAENTKRLPDKIKNRLKISYDSLEEEVKQIFMDIACFFTEKDQSIATRIWKASGWKVEHALQILRDKCLVEVIKQDCRNEITDEESAAFVFKMHNHLRDLGREMADAGENHRVWRILDPEYEALTTFKAIFEKAQEQRHRCFNSISDKSITYFIGNSEKSTNLQWLELNGSESIPSWIPLENLEGLRIRGRLPRKLWDDPQAPPLQLKELVCKFTNCGWMEKAMLRRNWKEISNSLGKLSRLESLVLQLESQENRKDIIIEWDSFVDCVKTLDCLKTLGLSGLYINGEIAYPSKETTDSKLSLESLTLSHIGHTTKISISGPSLKSLKLKQMEDLMEVNLSGVETLGCLELIQCDRLTTVWADALPKLEMLSVERCWEIEELPNLSYSKWLERTKITCCEELQNIIGIEELRWVDNITITCCPKLHSIVGLECLKGLKYMILSDGAMLSCVRELQELPSEFTVVMGKAATSFPKAAEMKRIIGALDDFQEISSESTAVTGRAVTSFPKEFSSESTRVTGRAVTSFPSAVKMTDMASSSTVTEESSESTLVSRAPTSFPKADEDEKSVIADALIESHSSIADALIEFHSRETAYTRLQELSEKMQQSLSAIILCAMVDGEDYGSKYMVEGRPSQTIDLSWAGGKYIYTILVTNPKQIYSAKDFSWLPTSCEIENGYIFPVNQGEESETLRILKRLTERLYRTATSESSVEAVKGINTGK